MNTTYVHNCTSMSNEELEKLIKDSHAQISDKEQTIIFGKNPLGRTDIYLESEWMAVDWKNVVFPNDNIYWVRNQESIVDMNDWDDEPDWDEDIDFIEDEDISPLDIRNYIAGEGA